VPNLALLLVTLALSVLGGGVANVTITSSLTRAVSHEDVGGSLGLSASLEGVASVAAPVIGGVLLQQVGDWAPGGFSALILAGLAVFTARTIRAAAPAVERSG
jgi:MFS family permease